jgi:hypothetical protein
MAWTVAPRLTAESLVWVINPYRHEPAIQVTTSNARELIRDQNWVRVQPAPIDAPEVVEPEVTPNPPPPTPTQTPAEIAAKRIRENFRAQMLRG